MLPSSSDLELIACSTNGSIFDEEKCNKVSGSLTFIHFLSNVAVELNGKQYKAYPGDCLLHESETSREFHGEDNKCDSDWCVFSGSGILLSLNTLDLPVNRVFRPTSTHFVAPLLTKIAFENERKSNQWEKIVSLSLQELLIKLSRHCFIEGVKLNGTLDPQEKLQEVRSIVQEQLKKQWTVAEMANLGNLSTSRFAFLYKKSFEVSPMEDLIRQRIHQATILLSDTGKSIAQIAEETGFEDLQYFYKAFKKRIGTTPKGVRERNSTSSPWKTYDEERGKLEAIWATSDFHGIIGSDENSVPHIQAVSGNWGKLGWNKQELTSQPLMSFMHPDEDSLIAKATETISAGGLLRNLGLRTLCKNGSYLDVAWTGAASGDVFYFSANFSN